MYSSSGAKVSLKLPRFRIPSMDFFFFSLVCVLTVEADKDALPLLVPSFYPVASSRVLKAASYRLLHWPRKGAGKGLRVTMSARPLVEFPSV